MNEIELVPYQPIFLDQMYEWRNQPSTLNFNPVEPISNEDFGKRCESVTSDLSLFGEHDRYRWCLQLDGDLIGHLGFTPNYKSKTAEIGYAINEALHGRGLATRAVRALSNKIFNETDIRKLTAGIHEKNVASLRVVEKVGFQREGVLRQQFLLQGIPADEIVFGLLRSEWVDR